jgi:hypothetical protein
MAVALTEHPAGFVSFRRQQPNHPPTQNDDSAVSPVSPAMQFGGYIAQITTTATFTTYETSGQPFIDI